MAYTNRHILIRFDGTQINEHAEHPKQADGTYLQSAYGDDGQLTPIHYPNLGDDIWVNVHNPMLMPQSMLLPDDDYATDAEGRPLDVRAAIEASKSVLARLVASWNVYDVFDMSERPQPIPTPVAAEVFDRIPSPIGEAISELIAAARNPH